MLGYGEDELDDHLSTWARLVHPDDKDRVLQQAHAYLNSTETSFDLEMRMRHRDGHDVFILSRAFGVSRALDGKRVRLVGTHADITDRKAAEAFHEKTADILEMIAIGQPASEVYDAIARMYEERHPGMRCSMLELHGNKLLHGGAPSLPKAYCDAIHGLENGPDIGSCGTATYTGKRVLVEDIATDPKWADYKHVALPHGMRCCWSQPIKHSSGTVLGAFGMYYDYPALPNAAESHDLTSAARLAGIVMERDQAQKRIRDLAYSDTLTGLNSRAYFLQTLPTRIATDKSFLRRFGLLYLDLDNFKCVNDSLGHAIGDLLLQEIAARLLKAKREADVVARLSGDEFCVLVEDVEDDFVAVTVAQRCLDAISRPVVLSGRRLTPTCSIGIAHYPDDGHDLVSLLKAGDTALYAAKECGRNGYAFYKPELTRKAEYRFLVEQCLKEAIEQRQFSLVYQPQVDVVSGEVTGVEALSRWNHPILGQIPPTEFIPIAERIGMIKPLTEWVLLTACRQAMAWSACAPAGFRMAVNISPTHFLDRDLVSLVQRVLAETGMDPVNLELEVTEGVVQTDLRNLSIFQELKALGVSLAIDDFGVGYSSFASLKHLNVDRLKIDKSFFDDILVNERTQRLVGAMIEMGHMLGYGLVAEGIEASAQWEQIRRLGCDTAQGFLFSRPCQADAISPLLTRRLAV